MYFEMYYWQIRFFILVCQVFFVIFLFDFICVYITIQKNKTTIKDNYYLINLLKFSSIKIMIIIISIISIIDFGGKIFLASKNPGSFYEEKNYTTEFFVLVSKYPFEENKGIYKVPALIHSVRGGLENNDYIIKEMYYNEKTIYFSDYFTSYIHYNVEYKCEDDENNIYYIKMTKEKCE